MGSSGHETFRPKTRSAVTDSEITSAARPLMELVLGIWDDGL